MQTSAPGLMNGLRGLPFSASSWTSELNGVPEGSRPTRVQTFSPSSCSAITSVNSLEIDWIENATRASPTVCTWPPMLTTAMPNWCGETLASSGM